MNAACGADRPHGNVANCEAPQRYATTARIELNQTGRLSALLFGAVIALVGLH